MTSFNQRTSLRGLRTFCVAAELSSFREAADRLFITASAVSHQIKSLEDEFGLKLFDRSPRAIRLTAAGKSLYDDVRPLIEELDVVTSAHRQAPLRTTLRISVQPFFASELFVPRLPDFRSRYPHIDIKIDTSDETAEKHPADADVSIRIFKSPPKSLLADRLFALHLTPAASPAFRDNLEVKGKKVSGSFSTIVHDTRPRAWREWQKKSGISFPENTTSLRLDSMIAVARAAERGLGAALVPTQLSDGWFDSGALVPLFDTELQTDDAYYFVCRSTEKDNENVRMLREWALSQFKDI